MTKTQEYQWLCKYIGTTPKAYVEQGLALIKQVNRKIQNRDDNYSPLPRKLFPK